MFPNIYFGLLMPSSFQALGVLCILFWCLACFYLVEKITKNVSIYFVIVIDIVDSEKYGICFLYFHSPLRKRVVSYFALPVFELRLKYHNFMEP